jgi:hypothetical protein
MTDKTRTQTWVRILAATLALLLLLVAGAWLLPAEWQVERGMVIHAPAAKIFPYLNNLKTWRDWAVWYTREPGMPVEYEGPDNGVGATSRWKSQDERRAMKIVRSDSDRRIEYLLLIDGGRSEMSGLLQLVPEADATRVVWRASGVTAGSPLLRYAALLRSVGIGRDFDASLARLKDKLEAR